MAARGGKIVELEGNLFTKYLDDIFTQSRFLFLKFYRNAIIDSQTAFFVSVARILVLFLNNN